MFGARSTGNIQKEAWEETAFMWLRQMSKFHHQALLVSKILCICTLSLWVFFSTVLPWEFVYVKLCDFIFWKWDLVVKFTSLM